MTPPNILILINIFIIMTTIEEMKQSYMFKIVRRALMREYKWIKDVMLDEEDYEQYEYNTFLILKIDPYELAEEEQWEVAPWVNKDPNYHSSLLSMFFKGNNKRYGELSQSIEDLLDKIVRSPAIPNELRLKPPRQGFAIGDYTL